MKTEYIREFVVLAETQNYLHASEQLFISQSSLSKHIKTLEEEIGSPLFDRTTRKVALSYTGVLFLPFAKEIIANHDEFRALLSHNIDGAAMKVSVGMVTTRYDIPEALATFQRNYPQYPLEIIEEGSSVMLKMIEENTLDFAFIRFDEASISDISKLPISTDRMLAAIPKEHPLAKMPTIPLESLQNEPLMLLNKNTPMYNAFVTRCRQVGFEPNIVQASRNREILFSFVEHGLGIAMVGENSAELMRNEGIVLAEISPAVETSVVLAYHKKKLTQAGASFLKWMEDFFPHSCSQTTDPALVTEEGV